MRAACQLTEAGERRSCLASRQAILSPKKHGLYTKSGDAQQREDIGKLSPACSRAQHVLGVFRGRLLKINEANQPLLRAERQGCCPHSDSPLRRERVRDAPACSPQLPGLCSSRTRFPTRLQNARGELQFERPRSLASNLESRRVW